MRKVVLYIAVSIDGYIADKKGSVDFIEGDGSDKNNMGSYDIFYNSIDTVILGKNTYEQIINELSPDKWVYKDKFSYVITSEKIENKENIIFTNELYKTIDNLKKEKGKDIWICGGASIVNQLLEKDYIDKIQLTIIPTILGEGIKLFNNFNKEIKLKLESTKNYNGFVDLVYIKR